jgi:hypothetical protein
VQAAQLAPSRDPEKDWLWILFFSVNVTKFQE